MNGSRSWEKHVAVGTSLQFDILYDTCLDNNKSDTYQLIGFAIIALCTRKDIKP